MKINKLIIIGVVVFVLFVLTGCSVNLGLGGVERATTGLVKLTGELTEIEKLIVEKEDEVINIEEQEQRLEGIEEKLIKLEEYTIDENFSERYTKAKARLEILREEIEEIKRKGGF